jgi:hypothetical protein
MEGGAAGHNFERDPPKDHPCQVWFNLVQEFQRRRFKLVVLVKKMSVLINFLLQKTNLVSVLNKICPNFAGHVWQDWHMSWILGQSTWLYMPSIMSPDVFSIFESQGNWPGTDGPRPINFKIDKSRFSVNST